MRRFPQMILFETNGMTIRATIKKLTPNMATSRQINEKRIYRTSINLKPNREKIWSEQKSRKENLKRKVKQTMPEFWKKIAPFYKNNIHKPFRPPESPPCMDGVGMTFALYEWTIRSELKSWTFLALSNPGDFVGLMTDFVRISLGREHRTVRFL